MNHEKAFMEWWASMPTCYSTSQRLMPNGHRVFKGETITAFMAGYNAGRADAIDTVCEKLNGIKCHYATITPENVEEAMGVLCSQVPDMRDTLAAMQNKSHQRRCWQCHHLGWYADSVKPYCLCDNCGSADTRREAAAQPVPA